MSGHMASFCGRSFPWVSEFTCSNLFKRSFHEGILRVLWCFFLFSGMSPYPNVVIDAQFYKMIKDGYHMPQPDFAPHEMWVYKHLKSFKKETINNKQIYISDLTFCRYTMMKMCWSLEPTQRPTFANIREFIANLLPKQSSQVRCRSTSLEQQKPACCSGMN